MHLVRRQRVDEMDPGRAPKIGVHCFPHHRAQVHRVHQLHVPVLLGDLPQGQHDVLHRLAIILPPVAGNKNDLLLPIGQLIQLLCGEAVVRPDCGLQSVDDRVAGDEQPLGNTLPLQVGPIVGGGTEIQVRNGGHQLPVHLLWKGRILVIGSQSCLHVPNGHLMVKG